MVMTRGWPRMPVEERFWCRINMTHYCWEWTGRTNTSGYGQIMVDRRLVVVHRFAYEQMVGPIPEGLTLDHLCRNRLCVRPEHLEPVTLRENILRGTGPIAWCAAKTHCIRGHEFTPENTAVGRNTRLGKTWRRCKACRHENPGW